MFSGKTEELIRRVKRAMYGKQRVQVFKPKLDARFHPLRLVSHSQQQLTSIPIGGPEDILTALDPQTQVLAVDEVQFLGPALVPICEEAANRGLQVICAGLDQDYLGNPLAIAEQITKLLAICVICGNPANRSQRVISRGERLVVGATEAYEARCRRCFVPSPVEATPPQTLDLFEDPGGKRGLF